MSAESIPMPKLHQIPNSVRIQKLASYPIKARFPFIPVLPKRRCHIDISTPQLRKNPAQTRKYIPHPAHIEKFSFLKKQINISYPQEDVCPPNRPAIHCSLLPAHSHPIQIDTFRTPLAYQCACTLYAGQERKKIRQKDVD
ncbi:hypothetical protein EYC80_006962 [Monilinia laxa]|uniref:Uncharacterized protein n=1 Tax=Monilinia laxa TaxID=61186 RepID=A0A5N6JZQ1_MONLA|nr:hypothetical protein EYC80_006962 [Monilinia laxa]